MFASFQFNHDTEPCNYFTKSPLLPRPPSIALDRRHRGGTEFVAPVFKVRLFLSRHAPWMIATDPLEILLLLTSFAEQTGCLRFGRWSFLSNSLVLGSADCLYMSVTIDQCKNRRVLCRPNKMASCGRFDSKEFQVKLRSMNNVRTNFWQQFCIETHFCKLLNFCNQTKCAKCFDFEAMSILGFHAILTIGNGLK